MHSNDHNLMPLGEWYQERFNSSPYNLMEHYAGDIANIAAQFDIDWDATSSNLLLSTGKGKASKVLRKKIYFLHEKSNYKGRVAIYAEEHSVNHDGSILRIPFFTFAAKGLGGESDSWNGFLALLDMYRREAGIEISEKEKQERQARLTEKERKRKEKLARLEAEQKAKEKAARESVERDLKLHSSLPFAAAQVVTAVTTPEKTSPDQVATAITTPGKTSPDQVATAVTTPGKTSPDQVATAVTTPGKTSPDQVATAVTTPGKTSPDQVATAVTTPEPAHKYAIDKRIIEALAGIDVRLGKDKRGRFLSILASSIHGVSQGLQKIYENKFQLSPKSKPTNKLFTTGMETSGAFFVIGDLTGAVKRGEPIRFQEGFATGCTIHLATKQVCIVAFNAGNLVEVFSLFCRYYPNNPKFVDADNDCWKAAEGKGNAGLLAALDCAKIDPTVKITFPTFEDMDTDSKPTDWNDVHCLHPRGLDGVRKKLRSAKCKLKAETKAFPYRLQRLALTKKEAVKEEALRAVNAGMSLVPFAHSATEVVDMVSSSLQDRTQLSPEELPELKRRAQWLMAQKMKSAQGFRNFTQETLTKPNISYERVLPVYDAEGRPLLPPKVLRKILALDGVIIVRAPMASGKTKHLLAPLMRNSQRGAYLAHRVSLIADACNRLSERDEITGRLQIRVDNYQDLAAPMVPMVQRMGCCINSITHPKFAPFFATVEDLLIDEASQTLRHVADGTVDNPVLVLEQLAEMMRSANRTVMCDADAGDALVEFAERACPNEPIHIIEMPTDCSHIEVLHTSDLMAQQQVVNAVKRGETALVADDSAKDGAALAQRLRTECEGVKVLHVHKDSKGEEDVEAFLADPNTQQFNWDVVIYSPAISSGVSIEQPHFRNHIGIFFGAVAPSDAIQMLRRDRTAQRYIVGFHITDYRRETDRDRIYRGRVAADRRALIDASGREPDWEETDKEFVARWRKTMFDDVWLDATAAERKARADFANNMLLILLGDGYRVSHLTANPLDEEQAKEGKALAKKAVTAERHALIHHETTPEEDVAQALMRRDVMSREEAAQLTRYLIKTQLCAPLVEQQDIEFWEDRGLKRLANFEALRANTETCQAFDNHLAEKGVTTTRRLLKTATHRLLCQVFESLGIDVESGVGEFTAQQAREAMDTVLCSEAAIEEYNELPIGAYVSPKAKPKCATTWAKTVLERLGLKVPSTRRGKVKKRVHFIDPDSWAQLDDYYRRRQAAGVSSLAIHDADSDPQAQPAPAQDEALLGAEGVPECGREGGPPSQYVYRTLDTKVVHPLKELEEKYPTAMALIEEACSGSDTVFRDEVVAGLTPAHWEDLEAGMMSSEFLQVLVDRFFAKRAEDAESQVQTVTPSVTLQA
ncbi:plasmid replication protein, CyRepA1 family (plasmid) [Microbulbifer sp. ANSA001]|uniref:plasmid replication protein, CyRepA1 family n=1 Tax=Microbulbifer sp. ANSA001 TaxID=3243358 RepID=UPI004041AA70